MNYKILGGLLRIAPAIKGMIFSDGKFNVKRTILLLLFSLVIGFGYFYLGEEGVAFVIDNLDEVSDIIGYEE